MRINAVFALLTVLAVPSPALAQLAIPGAPKVVATTPRNGAVVDPGPLKLSVTFDKPMKAGGWSFVTSGDGAYPDCGKIPVQSADKRTFTLTCDLAPNMVWALGFNSMLYRNFKSADKGIAAVPAKLWFRTAPVPLLR